MLPTVHPFTRGAFSPARTVYPVCGLCGLDSWKDQVKLFLGWAFRARSPMDFAGKLIQSSDWYGALLEFRDMFWAASLLRPPSSSICLG